MSTREFFQKMAVLFHARCAERGVITAHSYDQFIVVKLERANETITAHIYVVSRIKGIPSIRKDKGLLTFACNRVVLVIYGGALGINELNVRNSSSFKGAPDRFYNADRANAIMSASRTR